MTDIDPLLRPTFPAPSGPPQPPFVPATRSATTEPMRATPRTTRPRRRHPATGGRIIAAGLGATTMFGLIAAMGMAQASSTTNAPTTDESITLAPLPTITPAPAIAPVVGTPNPSVAAAPATDAPTSAIPAPIVLQARPDVQVVTPAPAQPAPAPIATTSGSA